MQEIYVDDFGSGFPLVLVHGFLGSSKIWSPQKIFLSKYFRIIAPDLPGFGKSSKIKSFDSINKMAKIILHKLEKKNIHKFNLLGHSMGGMIAQEMAKISSQKINKLICYSTGPIGKIPGRFESIDQSRANLKKKGLEITTRNIVKTWFVKGERAKYFNTCMNLGKQSSIEAADRALIAMKNWNGFASLKKIKNETLILWGDKDKSYKLNQVKILKKNIPNSFLSIIKNCAHNVHLEKTKEFNQKVKFFLKK